ncbi:MAG: aspartate aminotransferase family protein [Candidatus Latescibacterota bacterium]|nr:aspartate aminotransferase family protein [Candidatus Latescibacterota bacterium]
MTQSAVDRASTDRYLSSLDAVVAEYEARNPRSRALHDRAQRTLPGGNTRSGVNIDPFPVYADRGEGAYLYDVDGHQLLDFVNNASSLILGHADPEIVAAVQNQATRGTAFSRPTAIEVEMAELLQERMPALERVRFSSSGTEAVLNAVRVARAYTGRPKIAKFEGAYHGIDDPVLVSYLPRLADMGPAERPHSAVSTEGLAPGTTDSVLVMPFNDADASEAIISECADELAAIIIDPLSTAAGLTAPNPEFLNRLRQITEHHGILLIFDEIVSFRVHSGGTHSMIDVRPDLVTLGKVIAGGTPAAAFGGRADVMAFFDPTQGHARVWQSGTFNANPVSMATGLLTLRRLTPEVYDKLKARTKRLSQGLEGVFYEAGLAARVCAIGSLFRIYFLEEIPQDFRGAMQDDFAMHRWLFLSLLNRDIYWRNGGINALSVPTTDAEIDRLVSTVRMILTES